MSELKPEVVTLDQMQNDLQNNPNAFSTNTSDNMTPDSIPDLEKLTDDIIDFLKYMDKPEIKILRTTNYGAFQHKVDEKYPDIPFSIIKMLTDEDESAEQKSENIIRLLNMFRQLNDIKQGKKDITEGFESFREEISEEYIYPQFGGKEEFEKAVAKEMATKK